jgi:PST family polysaccharide transporter/teichuronic acid exporter
MSIKNQAITGVKWTSVSTAVVAINGLLKISILTRFLDKSDFGLIAITLLVLGFTELFIDMGLSIAIIHRQDITRKEYSSLYWINFIFSIVLCGVIIAISPIVAKFYNESELLTLLPMMSIILILSAVGRQFKTIEQKKLNFRRIAMIVVGSSLSSLALAIVLAIKGFGVYALVYAAIAQSFLSNMSFFLLGIGKNKILFHFKYQEVKPFLRIGLYQVGSQLTNYFKGNLDILIVGKFFGSDVLGGYSLAKQLVVRPGKMINPVLTRVGSPVLAKFQGSVERLRKNYLKLINLVAAINVPIYMGILIFAPLLVDILYGENYTEIVDLVRILSVFMMVTSVLNPVGSLVVATGRTDLEFFWNLFTLPFMPLAIIIGSQFSIEAVAIGMLLVMILLFVPFWWFLINRMIAIDFTTYLKWVIPKISSYQLIANQLLIKTKPV